MYKITQNGAFAGYADSIMLIKLHSNGCYVPCEEAEADGFCAKMAVTITDEEGTEPEGSYEEMGAALPLTDAETAAKILLGEEE